MFSFQMSTDPLYTYDSTHYTCSSTAISLILILIYSLHVVRKPDTSPASLLNICDLVTSIFNLVLGQGTTTTSPPSSPA